MLTQEEHVEIHALRKRGWSYSAIARRAGLSRNTVKAYLRDGRRPGERRRAVEDRFERYQEYVAQRLGGRSARLGQRAVRRGQGAGVRAELRHVRPGGAPAKAAAAPRGVFEPARARAHDRDRARAGRGDPMWKAT